MDVVVRQVFNEVDENYLRERQSKLRRNCVNSSISLECFSMKTQTDFEFVVNTFTVGSGVVNNHVIPPFLQPILPNQKYNSKAVSQKVTLCKSGLIKFLLCPTTVNHIEFNDSYCTQEQLMNPSVQNNSSMIERINVECFKYVFNNMRNAPRFR